MLKIIEKPDLPKGVFAQEASPELIAQAVRVYLANQRQGTQSALTRAEVNRTRKKVFKQKGTGHARHGDRKAPIFVGGGIAFAPKPRDYSLSLSGPMRTKARLGALTLKNKEKELMVVSGMEKLTGKTKELASFVKNTKSPNILIITDKVRENVWRAGRNLAGVEVAPANLVNTYQIMRAGKVMVMEEATEILKTAKETAVKVKKVKSPTRKTRVIKEKA